MCLYPRLIKNPKYKANKKNGGNVPVPIDKRVLLVPIGCGKCMECLRKKGNEWNVRLQEEIKTNKNGKFVTLTFSSKSLKELSTEITGLDGYERENEIATLAIRRFLERWRHKHKTSVRHWFVTELGQTGTEHIHIHGIIFTNETEDIINIWKYGHVFVGQYVNEGTIGYITKYVTKTDLIHKEYKPKILTSAGIGSNYTATHNAKRNAFKGEETEELYIARNGKKTVMPMYLRSKIYTEEEREKLWLQKLDKDERWVNGIKIIKASTEEGNKTYENIRERERRKNNRLGYGNDEINWDRKIYERNRRNLIMKERIEEIEIKKKKAKTRPAKRKTNFRKKSENESQ